MVKRAVLLIKMFRPASSADNGASWFFPYALAVLPRSSVSGCRSPDVTEGGFSLVELLLAVAIIIIALAPLMDSITASLESFRRGKENTLLVYYSREKMEDVRAMSFEDIPVSSPSGTPTALSDTVTVFGETVNRDVLVELYDGDGDLIPDSDLKKISVITGDVQQETLMADY